MLNILLKVLYFLSHIEYSSAFDYEESMRLMKMICEVIDDEYDNIPF